MYSPQLINIDLTEDKISQKKSIDKRVVDKFLGGRGIGVYLGYESIPVDTSPLGPDNNIIFGTGGLTRTFIPSSGMATATFKSPHTNTLCTSVTTGNFGAYLKSTGFDFLQIQGIAKSPIYILIDEFSDISLEKADDFWLKSISKTDGILRTKYGEKASITSIGKAAINKVVYAGAAVDKVHFYHRGGLGSVLASKNIKAIVLTEVPEPKSIEELSEEVLNRINTVIQDHSWTKRLTARGTFTVVYSMLEKSILSTRNCSRKLKLKPEQLNLFTGYGDSYNCWKCPINCIRNSYQNFLSLGPNLRIIDPAEIQNAINKCNHEGLDPISTGAALASLFHIQEDRRKLLDINLGFELGNPKVYSLIDDIVEKKELGDQLSRGEEYLYLQTSETSPMIKGQITGMYYYPNCPNLSIDLSTSSYGSDDFRTGGLIFPEILGYPYQFPLDQHYGKVKVKILLENLTAVLDSLIICSHYLPLFLKSHGLLKMLPINILSLIIHSAPLSILPHLLLEQSVLNPLIQSILSPKISISEIIEIGNRITLLERLYRTRAGITRNSDEYSRFIKTRPDFFKKQDCISMCDECNYCEEWAKKAVILDKEEAPRYVDSLNEYIDDLITGREFGIATAKPKEKKKKGLNWDPETTKIFEEMIKLTPPQFRSMARMAISSLAEEKAKKRASKLIENQDIVEAFIEGTPGPFQSDMKEGLKKFELLKE